MRVVAIVQNMNHCSWWRIEQPFNYLKANGVDTEICWLNSDELPTASITGAVVVLHRLAVKGGSLDDTDKWLNKLRKLRPKKIVYELDDDVISENYVKHMKACGRASLASLSQLEDERQKQIRLISLCDEITVSTDALNRVVSDYTRSNIYVLSNMLPIEWYRSRLVPNSEYQNKMNHELGYVTIGWAGGLRPDADFEEMSVAWKYISDKYPNVRFAIGGYQPNILWNAVDYDKIIRLPWASIEDWPQSMQVDIGCIPLAHTAFNKCKSPIKALEYAMAGALPIASNIVYGMTQLNTMPIVMSVDSWKYYLEYFIKNWLDRQLHVKFIQEQIEDRFDLAKNWVKWKEVYES